MQQIMGIEDKHMSDDSVIYQFKSAAKHQGRDVTEIEVRAPRMRDLKAIDAVKGDVAKMAKTIESLTGLTQREIDDLHYEDVKGLGEIVAAMFGSVQQAAAS
jgi:hypothetical protein